METKRLFIGTFVDSLLFESKLPEIKSDFEICCKGSWVDVRNLHFTYQFLGDVEMQHINDIRKAIFDYLSYYESEIEIKGLNALPKVKYPMVLYAQIINKDNKIIELQQQIGTALEKFGFRIDKRAFKPHITLLRIKSANRFEFGETIEKYKDYEFGSMNRFSIGLIESQLTKRGPIYRKI